MLGLAAVFAGLTAVLTIAALTVQPILLIVALPFAATTYFLWFHVTGRLADRAKRRERQQASDRTAGHGRGEGSDRATAGERTDRPGASNRATRGRSDQNTRTRADQRRSRARRRAENRSRPGDNNRSRRGGAGRSRPAETQPTLSRAEACRILGVSQDAEQDAIRAAYREQVKRAHPDTDAGDEESFKRLNRAYERLRRE